MLVEKDYEELLKLFNSYKVRYCVVGAYALAVHAVPRYTKDIDLFVEPDPENSAKIFAALKKFGFSKIGLGERDFSKSGVIVQLGYEPLRIDIMTSIDGCSFREVWKHKKTSRYGKQTVHFIGLKELIKNKRASGRAQDRIDLGQLKRISKGRKKVS